RRHHELREAATFLLEPCCDGDQVDAVTGATTMIRLLGLSPRVTLVIVGAVLAYVVYRVASTGTVQPLTIILLIVQGFALVRVLWRLRGSRTAPEDDNDA